jgi:hypothetical protein
MSRILKRPMFRIGGSANEGIMNMAVPKRGNYAVKGDVSAEDNYDMETLYKDAARRAAILSQFAGTGRSQSDRISDLLISGGLNLVGGVGAGGGTLSSIAKSFKQPTEQFLKGSQEEEAFKRQINLGAASSAMSTADAIALQRAKLKQEYAAQTIEAQSKEYSAALKDISVPFIQNRREDISRKVVSFRAKNPQVPFHGLAIPTQDAKTNKYGYKSSDLASIPEGQVFYEPISNTFKKRTATGIVLVDENTGKEITAPTPSSTNAVNTPSVNVNKNPYATGREKFYEEYYKNNPGERPNVKME